MLNNKNAIIYTHKLYFTSRKNKKKLKKQNYTSPLADSFSQFQTTKAMKSTPQYT